MLDRVLKERLEDQTRHEGVDELRGDVDPRAQAIRKSRFLDLEVDLQDREFPAERDQVARAVSKTEAQKLRQAGHRARGGAGVTGDEGEGFHGAR